MAISWILKSISAGVFLITLPLPGWSEERIELPQKISELNLFSDLVSLTPNENLMRYNVNFPLWSDGAAKTRWVYVPTKAKIKFSKGAPWALPDGTILVKQFNFGHDNEMRVESRVMLKTALGWKMASYFWQADLKDATRVDRDVQVQVVSQASPLEFTWTVPRPSQCVKCHSRGGDEVLGFNTPQFGLRQLKSWAASGRISKVPADVTEADFLPVLNDPDLPGKYSNEEIARAYLQVNCASCHHPGGFVPTQLNLSWRINVNEMHAVNVAPEFGNLGVEGAAIIKPGNAAQSMLAVRMLRNGSGHMPHLGSVINDPVGTEAIIRWINSLSD